MRTIVGFFLTLLAAVPACQSSRPCVPDEVTGKARLVDLCAAPDAHAPVTSGLARRVMDGALKQASAELTPGGRPYHFLALSGGGLYGSFGVGVLSGWTAGGSRPPFDVVTGISVGSLQATYAFLGPAYDEVLKEQIVGKERRDILRPRFVYGLLCSSSLFSAARLRRQIWEAITPDILCEVAKAHAAGRRLYLGSCNVDTGGLVVWDMGAIASRGTPEALELYRTVVLASVSIPTAMPPVELPVVIDGKCYTELHADGATADGVFFRPFMVADLNRDRGVPSPYAPAGSRLYVINNGKMYAAPSCVRPRVIPLAAAANSALIDNKKRDEVFRMYMHCLETGVDFSLARVPVDLELEATSSLSVKTADQLKLYETGYQIGLAGHAGPGWRDTPSGTDESQQVLPRTSLRFATRPKEDGGTGPTGERNGGLFGEGVDRVPAINPKR